MKVNCIISRSKLWENEKLIYDESVTGRRAYGKQGGEEIAYVYRALVWKPEEKKDQFYVHVTIHRNKFIYNKTN